MIFNFKKMNANLATVIVLFLGLLPQAMADLGGGSSVPKSTEESVVGASPSPISDSQKLRPWETIQTWGKFLPDILSALEELKASTLDREEWQDYKDFYNRTKTAADLLQNGEVSYSGKTLGYLYVMTYAYLDLKRSEGYKEDLSHHYNDNRSLLVRRLSNASEKLMVQLLDEGNLILMPDGSYKVNIGLGESIVRSFGDSLIHITDEILTLTLSEDKKNAFLWLKQAVLYINNLKGGDGTSKVDMATKQIIGWYDAWNKPGQSMFVELLVNLNNAKLASRDRNTKYEILAGQVDQFIGLMEAIENHVGFGAGFPDIAPSTPAVSTDVNVELNQNKP